MNKTFKIIKNYYSDKKNRIVHAIAGISMLLMTIFDFISPYLRIGVFTSAICFNILRMRFIP